MQRFLRIRSRNHTARGLVGKIPVGSKRVVLRLGSTTPIEDIYKKRYENIIELNSVEACKTSGNKLLMKKAFSEAGVITADWWNLKEYKGEAEFPLIIKHVNSSKGNGIYFISTQEELDSFLNVNEKAIEQDKYIIEKYLSYVREYRLHVTKEGCFYSCRKMLKEGAEERWHRHDNNSVWILEENPLFDKPSNWEAIVEESIKAMTSCGLDICAVDVKVQSNQKKEPKFIILETNSAPSLGKVTTEKYIEHLTQLFNGNL